MSRGSPRSGRWPGSGAVVEDGAPEALLAENSRYRSMIEAERAVLDGVWGDPSWRRVSLRAGAFPEAEDA